MNPSAVGVPLIAGAGRRAGSPIVERTPVMMWAVVGVVAAVLVCMCTVTLMRKRGRTRG